MSSATVSDLMRRHLLAAYGSMPTIWLGLLFTAASHFVFKIVAPLLMANFAGRLLAGGRGIDPEIAAVALTFAVGMLLGVLGDYVFIRESDGRYAFLVGRFHDLVVAKPASFFREQKAGVLSDVFRQHMDGTINLVRFLRVDIIPVLMATVGPVVVLAGRDVRVATVFGIGVALHAYLTIRGASRLKPLRKAALAVYHQLSGVMGDQMANLAILRVSGDMPVHRSRVTDLATEEGRLFWKRHRLAIFYNLLGLGITAGCFIGVLAVIAGSAAGGLDRVELAILSMIFIVQGLHAAGTVSEISQKWGERWEHATQSLQMLGGLTPISTERGASEEGPSCGGLAFRGVKFAYSDSPSSRLIFNDVNLVIPDGMHVAITGRNGVGKSTLVNLLLGFDKPLAGVIHLGGRDVRDYTDRQLYSALSYVPQEPRLFNLSIRENLYFFAADAAAERVRAAFDLAQIDSVLANKPAGIDSPAGEMGTLLSGGERQRVAIARALLRDAKIYIFDEPTSALHGEDALDIVRKTRVLLRGRTLLLITHSRDIAAEFENVIDVRKAGVQWVRGGSPQAS